VLTIADRLSQIPAVLAPIAEAAVRYSAYPSKVGGDETLYIGQRPWIAPQSYTIIVYPGIDKDIVGTYQARFGINIPESYTKFLHSLGGAFLFGMSLYGIPPSMMGDPPVLDRSKLQCLDLATANKHWRNEFNTDPNFCHFGSRHFSRTEDVGYFINDSGIVLCVRCGGAIQGEWQDFSQFLKDELATSEDLENSLHPPQWKD
jgi:hypothetical protein